MVVENNPFPRINWDQRDPSPPRTPGSEWYSLGKAIELVDFASPLPGGAWDRPLLSHLSCGKKGPAFPGCVAEHPRGREGDGGLWRCSTSLSVCKCLWAINLIPSSSGYPQIRQSATGKGEVPHPYSRGHNGRGRWKEGLLHRLGALSSCLIPTLPHHHRLDRSSKVRRDTPTGQQ